MKNFYIFAVGQYVSQFGSQMTSFGLVLWSYKQSGSVLSASLLLVSSIVPKLLLSYFAGNLADHWKKKAIMLISDSAAALLSIGVLGMLLSGHLRIEYLYIINLGFGITDSFQWNASTVAVSSIISKKNYIKTSGIRSFFNSVTNIFYPIAATSVYAIGGLKIIVIVDLFTFIFAFTTLFFGVKIPETVSAQKGMPFREQCMQGFIYLGERKDIFSLILFMGFVNFIAGIYSSCLTPMVLARTGNNDLQLGIVSSTVGIAGMVGSLIVSKMKPAKKKISQMLNIMGLSFLICNSMLGIGRNYFIWAAMIFIGNVLIPVVLANEDYLERTLVPKELLGKVLAVRSIFQYIAMISGYLLAGALSDKILEPFMNTPSKLQAVLAKIVGGGSGSGIALIYICIAIGGFTGCCIFKQNRDMMSLDNVE